MFTSSQQRKENCPSLLSVGSNCCLNWKDDALCLLDYVDMEGFYEFFSQDMVQRDKQADKMIWNNTSLPGTRYSAEGGISSLLSQRSGLLLIAVVPGTRTNTATPLYTTKILSLV
ncbi:hypothetical protein J6590_040713 [Homalodisca vitripennis]|nr:hypothetical protein J6590_040713 [Homalodisca vitripennis]